MTASVYKDQDVSQRPASAALPKVNVRPATVLSPSSRASAAYGDRMEPSDAVFSAKASPVSMAKSRRKDWDIRFAIGLVAVVVLVNISLTLLLGGERAPDIEQATIRMEASAPETEQRPSGDGRSADVYISSEEKRLLLRHLYAPEARDPHPRNNEQGTYRSLSKSQDQPLSIIGAGPSAGE